MMKSGRRDMEQNELYFQEDQADPCLDQPNARAPNTPHSRPSERLNTRTLTADS